MLTQTYQQKKALNTHHNIAHLGRRDFICPHEHCKRAFGYKHLLQRHLAKLHTPIEPSSDHHHDSGNEADTTDCDMDVGVDIDFLTGKAYAIRARKAIQQAYKLHCPFSDLPPLLSRKEESGATASGSKRSPRCQYVFSRAYDLRRHLQAEHGLVVERENVDTWVRDEKESLSAVTRTQ